jgi:hypothetical protein
MRRLTSKLLALLPLSALLAACIGTTGSDIVTFNAYGAGVVDAPSGGLLFTNALGWDVRLTKATLHVGALYLNRSVPVSGGQERACFLPGVYVAQVVDGRDIDVLSSRPQPFPKPGTGSADPAATGEVWLTGGRVDAPEDRTTIADVAGTVSRGGSVMRFEASVTIGQNRVVAATDPARPGAYPLCAQRIVTPIPVSLTPTAGGALVLRVDPRVWFANVEFGDLTPVTPGGDLVRIPDETVGQPASNFYRALRASGGVYTFEWLPKPP